jgi:DNA-binding NarL/FixJ family response regulator
MPSSISPPAQRRPREEGLVASLGVVIVHGEPLFREGLAAAVERSDGLELLGSATDELTAADVIAIAPHVAVVDVDFPGIDAVALVSALSDCGLRTHVLLVEGSDDGPATYEALAAGAAGCVSASAAGSEICDAIRTVGRGDASLSSATTRSLLAGIRARRRNDRLDLTTRERDVLGVLGQGASNREIARQLFISVATVKSTLQHVYRKLNVRTRAGAVAEALRRRVFD